MGGWESPSHWVIIAILAIVLFGYKKLPDASRAVGRSLRNFKTELRGESEDDKGADPKTTANADEKSTNTDATSATTDATSATVDAKSTNVDASTDAEPDESARQVKQPHTGAE